MIRPSHGCKSLIDSYRVEMHGGTRLPRGEIPRYELTIYRTRILTAGTLETDTERRDSAIRCDHLPHSYLIGGSSLKRLPRGEDPRYEVIIYRTRILSAEALRTMVYFTALSSTAGSHRCSTKRSTRNASTVFRGDQVAQKGKMHCSAPFRALGDLHRYK